MAPMAPMPDAPEMDYADEALAQAGAGAADGNMLDDEESGLMEVEEIRDNFVETWLFLTIDAG